MNSSLIYLKDDELDQLSDLVNTLKIRKEMNTLLRTEEVVLHCLIYKLVFYCSKLSVIETNKYLERHPEETENILHIKQKYDKDTFETLFCFIKSIESMILCVAREQGKEKGDEVLGYVMTTLNQHISGVLLTKDMSFQEMLDFFSDQVEQFLQEEKVIEDCSLEFFKNLEACRMDLRESSASFDEIKRESNRDIAVIDNQVGGSVLRVVENDKGTIDIYTKIENYTASLPEFTINECKRLSATICNACYQASGYVPRPIRCLFNVFYNLVETAIPFIPPALLLVQCAYLTNGVVTDITPEHKELLKNTVTFFEVTKSILPAIMTVGNITKAITTTPIGSKDPKKIIREQERALQIIFRKAASVTRSKYKGRLGSEARTKRAIERKIQLEKQEELRRLEELQLEEQEELERLEEIETKRRKEKAELEYRTQLENAQAQLVYQEQYKKIQGAIKQINRNMSDLIELKENYKEMQQPIVFFRVRNIPQTENIRAQDKKITEVRRNIKHLIEEMKSLDSGSQLYIDCCTVINKVRYTSNYYCLGIVEVYEFAGEEMNEIKPGISYTILNSMNTFMPQQHSSRMIRNISEMVPPAEKIGMREIMWTGLSMIPLFKLTNVRSNAEVAVKIIRSKGRQYVKSKLEKFKQPKKTGDELEVVETADKPVVKRGRGRPPKEGDKDETKAKKKTGAEEPELKKMQIEFKPYKLPVTGFIAFNAYLYGNLIERKILSMSTRMENMLQKMSPDVELFGERDFYREKEELDAIEEKVVSPPVIVKPRELFKQEKYTGAPIIVKRKDAPENIIIPINKVSNETVASAPAVEYYDRDEDY